VEHLGKSVVIAGSTGEILGDVIDFRFDPLQFRISFYGNSGELEPSEWVEGDRYIGDRNPTRQTLPVIGNWPPPLPRDDVVRLLAEANVQRNIKGWPALEHNIVVEYLCVAPGSVTIEIIRQVTADVKATTFMVAKAVSTMFRIWARIIPRSPAVCPSCGINVVFNMVEDEIVHGFRFDTAITVPVKCVCNRMFVVNRSAMVLPTGVTYFNVSFATQQPSSPHDCPEHARDHMMRHLHILETAVVARGGVISNDMWDVIHRLPVSDVRHIMNSIEHIDDPLEAVVIAKRMSADMMSAYMAEVPKGFHCVACGSFQTLNWGLSSAAGRQSGEGCHKCNLGMMWDDFFADWRNGITYMNAHVFFDDAVLHRNVSFIMIPFIFGEADNL